MCTEQPQHHQNDRDDVSGWEQEDSSSDEGRDILFQKIMEEEEEGSQSD